MKRVDFEDVDVSVEDAINRMHTLLHRATRARKLSKIRDELYKVQSILVSVEEAVSCSSVYDPSDYVTLDRSEMED